MPVMNRAKNVAKHIFYAPLYGANYSTRLARKHIINPLQNFGADLAFRNTALIGPNGLRPPIENRQLDPVRQTIMQMTATSQTGSAGRQTTNDPFKDKDAEFAVATFYENQRHLAQAETTLKDAKAAKLNRIRASITTGAIAVLGTAVVGPFVGAALLPISFPLVAMLGVALAGIGAVSLGSYYVGSRAKRSLAERVANKDLVSRQTDLINAGNRVTNFGADRGKQQELAEYLSTEGATIVKEMLDLFEDGSATKIALENLIVAYKLNAQAQPATADLIRAYLPLEKTSAVAKEFKQMIKDLYPAKKEDLAVALRAQTQENRDKIGALLETEAKVKIDNIIAAYEIVESTGAVNIARLISAFDKLDVSLTVTTELKNKLRSLYAEPKMREALAEQLRKETAAIQDKVINLFENGERDMLRNIMKAYEQKEKLEGIEKDKVGSEILEETLSILDIIGTDLSIHELLSEELKQLAPAELARIQQKPYAATKAGLLEAYADLESVKQLGETADVAKQLAKIRDLSANLGFVIQAGPAGEVKEFYLMPSDKDSEALIARKNSDRKTFTPIISGAYIVGEGGQADVYKAYNPETGEEVAVKVLRFEGLEDRFEKEYKAMKKADHPGVVQVYSYGKINGKALIVEELIRSSHLGAHIYDSDGKLPPREAAEIAMKISVVMDDLAQLGITHRDLKLENIFYDHETKEVKISDFGLAKDIEGAEQTQTMTGFGTRSYMSPWFILYMSTPRTQREREKDKMHDLLVRHDMYAIGVMLYEMATGKSLTWRSEENTVTRISSEKFADDPFVNEEITWEQYATGDFLTYWKAKLTKVRAEREKIEIQGQIKAGAQNLAAELEVKEREIESAKQEMNEIKAKYTLVDTYNQEGIVVPQDLMDVISRMSPIDPEETFEHGHYEASQNLAAVAKGKPIPRATLTSGQTQFVDVFAGLAPRRPSRPPATPPPLPPDALPKQQSEEKTPIVPSRQHEMEQPTIVEVIAPDVENAGSVRQFLSAANDVLGDAAMGGEPVTVAYVQEVFGIIGEIQEKYADVEFVQRQIGIIQTTIGDLSVKGRIK